MNMKTQQEILAKMAALEDGGEEEGQDFFGFFRTVIIQSLEFENAKPYLIEGTATEKWKPAITDDDVKKAMLDYMPFAWEKANDERGLSANRSLEKMCAWVWLLDDGFYPTLSESYWENYSSYGKPQLKQICEQYGWDWKQWDDGKWK